MTRTSSPRFKNTHRPWGEWEMKKWQMDVSLKDIRKGHGRAVSKCQREEKWGRWAAVRWELPHAWQIFSGNSLLSLLRWDLFAASLFFVSAVLIAAIHIEGCIYGVGKEAKYHCFSMSKDLNYSVWNFGPVFLSCLSKWPRFMPITEVPLSDDHNEANWGSRRGLGESTAVDTSIKPHGFGSEWRWTLKGPSLTFIAMWRQ